VAVSLAHLDRPFDYQVPAALSDDAVPGARVVVRFAGQQVSGFVLERVERSEHAGQLAALRRVVSAEPILRPPVARAARTVADHYAGTLSDVLRLAVPPRHARVEQEPVTAPRPGPLPAIDPEPWAQHVGAEPWLHELAAGGSPRVVTTLLAGIGWCSATAQAVLATLASGRGALLCLPDVRDVARLDAVLTALLGPGRHVVLTAELGPAARYRAFLSVARGHVRAVIGTRAAAFAPVQDLGLVGCWDDGDDLLSEPRAPYPHAREVLLIRAHQTGAGVLLAAHTRSPEAQQLVRSGWCTDLSPSQAARRAGLPRVDVTGAGEHAPARDPAAHTARLPSAAIGAARAALATGPVLVQVPRAGYRPALACQHCRTPARCSACEGPLSQARADAAPTCAWCGSEHRGWACTECGGTRLRAPVTGERLTAEQLGRTFPGVRVRSSAGDAVLDEVDAEPAIVVATPGAEPPAEDGYAAALLLDTWILLARADLRAAEEALRRWANAAALVRPSAAGGRVVVVGDPATPVVQALVRGDPAGFAERELDDRLAARLPPAVRLATVTGPRPAIDAAVEWPWPQPVELLGPVLLPRADRDEEASYRLVVRVPRASGASLSRSLAMLQSSRSTRKLAPFRVQVDPLEVG
jgi:primosomal protein N' (replication factor Y)